LAFGVVVLRSVYVDGGAVVSIVEEVGAGASFREEALGLRGEPVAVVLDEGEPLLLKRGSGLTFEAFEVLGAVPRVGEVSTVAPVSCMRRL
jgi:hypothetical protein